MKKILVIMISVLCILNSTLAFSSDEKKVAIKDSSQVKEEVKANATQGKTQAKTPTLAATIPDITKEEIQNCQNISGSIREGISELGECWKDTDCLVVNFGCPWQEGPCHHSIAGKDEQDKFDEVNKKIFAFNKMCLPKSPSLQKRCDIYKKNSASVKCSAQPLACLNGRCVTKTELMLQEMGIRPGSYGYKKKPISEK